MNMPNLASRNQFSLSALPVRARKVRPRLATAADAAALMKFLRFQRIIFLLHAAEEEL
jgi:hypothetical protein